MSDSSTTPPPEPTGEPANQPPPLPPQDAFGAQAGGAGAPPPPGPGPDGAPSGISSDHVVASVQGAHKFDLGLIIGGVLVFLFSLLPYYTFSAELKGGGALSDALSDVSQSASITAWHGFFGWFAALVALVVAVVVALKVIGMVEPALANLVALVGVAVAGVCVVIALFVIPNGGSDLEGSVELGGGVSIDVSTGHGVGYWLSLLILIAMGALVALRQTDDGS